MAAESVLLTQHFLKMECVDVPQVPGRSGYLQRAIKPNWNNLLIDETIEVEGVQAALGIGPHLPDGIVIGCIAAFDIGKRYGNIPTPSFILSAKVPDLQPAVCRYDLKRILVVYPDRADLDIPRELRSNMAHQIATPDSWMLTSSTVVDVAMPRMIV